MNKIILCEGETDAILLSYFLGKVAGWKYCKKPPVNTMNFKRNSALLRQKETLTMNALLRRTGKGMN